MRDDVAPIVDSLVSQCSQWRGTIEKLIANLTSIRQNLRSGFEETVADIVDENAELIEQMQALDYEIGSNRDRLNTITGFPPGSWSESLLAAEEIRASGLPDIIATNERLSMIASAGYRTVLSEMNESRNRLVIETGSFQRFMKLRNHCIDRKK